MIAAGGIFALRKNKLYRNDGGVFNDVSGNPVIPGFSVLDLMRHVMFEDYDADGWLDMMVVNDDLAGGGPIKIYMNQHPGGVFSHFTEEHALRGLNEQASCGGVSIDVDQDGDMDLYSGNYPDVTSEEGNKISVADLNNDGRTDVVVGMVDGRPAVLRNTSVDGWTTKRLGTSCSAASRCIPGTTARTTRSASCTAGSAKTISPTVRSPTMNA